MTSQLYEGTSINDLHTMICTAPFSYQYVLIFTLWYNRGQQLLQIWDSKLGKKKASRKLS